MFPKTSLGYQESRALIGAVYPGFHMDRILYFVRQVYNSGNTKPNRVLRRGVDSYLDRTRKML